MGQGRSAQEREASYVAGVIGHLYIAPGYPYRVARLAKVSVDDVLTGKFPPAGTCPHCGNTREEKS